MQRCYGCRAACSNRPAAPSRLRCWPASSSAKRFHLRHQREQAAQQQFELAMRITDRTLEHVQQQLSDVGVRFGD